VEQSAQRPGHGREKNPKGKFDRSPADPGRNFLGRQRCQLRQQGKHVLQTIENGQHRTGDRKRNLARSCNGRGIGWHGRIARTRLHLLQDVLRWKTDNDKRRPAGYSDQPWRRRIEQIGAGLERHIVELKSKMEQVLRAKDERRKRIRLGELLFQVGIGCAKAVNVSSRLRCLRTKTGNASSALRPFASQGHLVGTVTRLAILTPHDEFAAHDHSITSSARASNVARISSGQGHEHADAPHPLGLLRTRRERPRGRPAAEGG
jgi:hypothetical protein